MNKQEKRPVRTIQREILNTLMILIIIMTALVSVISIIMNVCTESESLDRNLQNIARAVAQSQIVENEIGNESEENNIIVSYLDSMKETLMDIDVISVIRDDSIRMYHTNHELIGTVYDGTLPDFSMDRVLYVTGDTGPSGSQRRAYAAVYDSDGNYCGFVLAVMLRQNINRIILSTVIIHLMCGAAIIFCAVVLSEQLSERIKQLLNGYEPGTFSAMFSIRENILETLEEGIIAVDRGERIIYMNRAARSILHYSGESSEGMLLRDAAPDIPLGRVIAEGEKIAGLAVRSDSCDIITDCIPVTEQGETDGALCIIRDRSEYTKIMEDLSGVRYMVESMRANNHDHINKLHVILGLIKMGRNDDAAEYIAHITSIQQKIINNIIRNIEDPSVAALLIGKYARASELNIRFALESGSRLSRNDISLPSGDLVTIIGNLMDNAMDSMNEKNEPPKELTVGIFTEPHVMVINVDDTGNGISEDKREKIFENGFSTKGDNRGTGLYAVRGLIKKYGGNINVESEEGTGTVFTVTLTDAS